MPTPDYKVYTQYVDPNAPKPVAPTEEPNFWGTPPGIAVIVVIIVVGLNICFLVIFGIRYLLKKGIIKMGTSNSA